MNADELDKALQWVEEAEKNFAQYGDVGYIIPRGNGVATETVDIRFPLARIRPMLLARRAELSAKSLELRMSAIVKRTDPQDTEILELQGKVKDLSDELQSMAKANARADDQERIERMKRETSIHKAKLWQSWFTRESIASLMGALLLFIFGLCVVYAMISHTAIPDLLSNAFLLILGYFFGQSTGRRADRRDEHGGD